MGKTFKQKLAELSLERRQKIEAETRLLIAEEMTRQQLRQVLTLTQEQMATLLQVDQGNISRLEQRTDLMLSTLRKYITAETLNVDTKLYIVDYNKSTKREIVNITSYPQTNEHS